MAFGSATRYGLARVRSRAALALLVAVCLARPAGAAELRQHLPMPERVPVVLVPGLGGDARATWGRPPESRRSGTGLVGYLVGLGYEEGRDLFLLDYSRVEEPDCVRLAACELARRLDDVRERTGSALVDLVSYGYGGLICRYYLQLPGQAAGVRTLVMISPPNRGSFSAHLLKVAIEQARQQPWPATPSAGAPATAASFVNAAAYLEERTVAYGMLYGEYLAETELLGGPGRDAQGRAVAFAEWLALARPELFRCWFLEGQLPPREPPSCPEIPPGEGEALTRAYYEWLALETGVHHYLKAATRRTVSFPSPPASLLGSPDLRQAIWEYLRTVVLKYVYPRAVGYVEENWAKLALEVLCALNPRMTDEVALERLVPERLRYPAGPDAVGRPTYHGLVANHFLLTWNRQESSRVAGPRYVVIAGRTLNLAGRLWRGVGDNDLVVELESTLVPLAPDDCLHVFGGLWRGNHLALLYDPRVHRAVGEVLQTVRRADHRTAVPLRPTSWQTHGRGHAGAWQPTYLRITGEEGLDGGVRITLTAGQPRAATAANLAYHAWAHVLARDGTVLRTQKMSFQQRGPLFEAELDLPVPGTPECHELLIGVKLVPLPRPGEGHAPGDDDGVAAPARDPWAAALLASGGKSLGFSYRVSRVPFPPAGTAGDASPGPDTPPPRPDDVEGATAPGTETRPTAEAPAATNVRAASPQTAQVPAGGTVAAQDAGATPPPGPAGPLPGPADTTGLREASGTTGQPPRIEVKTVRKLTTQKKESRTYHVRWEWELGDGRRLVEEEAGRLVATLTPEYTAAGSYTVRAFSFSNQGQILREQRWTLNVPAGAGPDRPWTGPTLRTETIGEPRVVVALEGPATWVTGRPAAFRVRAWVDEPAHGRIVEVTADPGWHFEVLWERPGTYAVAAAVSVKVNYSLAGRSMTFTNTYLHGVKVDVAVPAMSR